MNKNVLISVNFLLLGESICLIYFQFVHFGIGEEFVKKI